MTGRGLEARAAQADRSSALPAGLGATLDITPEGPVVLLLRHADRPVETGRDVPITPVGHARAATLGRRLGPRLERAAASPARRCVQTARAALEAAGQRAEVVEHELLGMSGPFVADLGQSMRLAERLGAERVVRALIAGHALPGLRTPAEGTRRMLALVRARLGGGADPSRRPASGATLLVSHDVILMPVIATCSGDSLAGRWLDPLDGMAFWREGARLVMGWEGRRHLLPEALADG